MRDSALETGVLRFGHSPDPDDAFMFFGLARGAVRIRDFRVEHVLHDIQTLNEMAMAGAIEVTAISAHAYPSVADRYWIMRCGASMGIGYGPILVARPGGPDSLEALAGARVAIPGLLTTAYLVARLYLPEFESVVYPFDDIPRAVVDGEVDVGLVIHEGQITYGDQGLAKIGDLGVVWRDDTGLPLPLGLDVVRKDLGRELAGAEGKRQDVAGIGHFFVVIRLRAFSPWVKFRNRFKEMLHQVTTAPAAGAPRIYYPGEAEFAIEQERRATGIPLDKGVASELEGLARRLDMHDAWEHLAEGKK